MLYIKQLLYFTYEQALSCLFPVVIFLTLALSKIVSIPGLYRYDFILIVCLLMQWVMYKTGLETKDELKVITVFHLIGLLLEIYKVHFGSWSYPEEAYSKVFEFHFTAALCMQVLQVTYAKRGEDYIYKCIIGRKLFL